MINPMLAGGLLIVGVLLLVVGHVGRRRALRERAWLPWYSPLLSMLGGWLIGFPLAQLLIWRALN